LQRAVSAEQSDTKQAARHVFGNHTVAKEQLQRAVSAEQSDTKQHITILCLHEKEILARVGNEGGQLRWQKGKSQHK
jgi:hypothetical protein